MSTRLEQIERSNSIHNFGLTQKVSMSSKVRMNQIDRDKAVYYLPSATGKGEK